MNDQDTELRTQLPNHCPLCGADALKEPHVWHQNHATAEYWCGTTAADDLHGYKRVQVKGQYCNGRAVTVDG